ncbi:B12-binding domain-containing radical SAM protein, partial [bacterium]|nr:B12-binding domain-containing radical SAM protein [candidate division CSSED10-310 bacterium]
MKVTLVSPYSDITSLGVRFLSAVLKRAGHTPQIIFLPHRPAETLTDETSQIYERDRLEAIAEACAGSGLIGISLMTNYFERARVLTDFLRDRLTAPIIWGGIHPTIRPDECLDSADLVCVGEGEELIVELAESLAQNRSTAALANLGWRADGGLRLNKARPLILDLDALPYPDYDHGGHLVWDEDSRRLRSVDIDLFREYLSRGHISRIRNEIAYQTIATRGCPHDCSYCCNNALRDLYRGQQYLRRRSTGNILGELEEMRARFPFIKVIGFSDDSFFADNEAGIEAFARAYKERVGLPFFCLGSPLTITRRKMVALVAAGMFGIQMGIQTGSESTKKLYNRSISNRAVIDAANIINEFSDVMIPPTYDFIIDNPLETREDLLQTIDLMLRLPRPHRLQIFSLVIFPETGIYRRLVEAGHIKPFGPEAYSREYHQHGATYLNLVLSLLRNGLPAPVIRFLIRPGVVRLADRPVLV